MTTTGKTYHAFVYGTLKGMHRGTFLDQAQTIDSFVMMDGGFPMCASVDAGIGDPNYAGNVVGELYTVNEDELRGLDHYEGTDSNNDPLHSFYVRKEVPIRTKNGTELTAWMYFGAQAKDNFVSNPQVKPNDLGQVEWR